METATLVQEVQNRKPSLNKDKYTDYLHAVAPDHLEYAKEHTNNDFTDAGGVEIIPRNVLNFVAEACEYGLNPSGLESRTMGDVSYNFEADYPSSMLRKLKPYKRVKF